MKRLREKKELLLIIVIVLLFVFMSSLSITSINQMRGNARVVNYAGIVRGATQRLVKKELQGYPDDALTLRLDSIISELISGEGPNNLIALKDPVFQDLMNQITRSFSVLKEEIALVRAGEDKLQLFELSEEYFNLVDKTVSAAETFSEQQVKSSMTWMISINIIFVGLIGACSVVFLRSATLKRRADALGKIAYLDPLTQMPNRASCEREINRCSEELPEADFAVLMFDMNNLKLVNDHLGHQGGDRIIADFARIIKTEAVDFGFVGRYGGDEFVAIFPNCDETAVTKYLARINEKFTSYNLLHVHPVEKISFAVGFVIENQKNKSLIEMIDDADGRMYIRKRQMKENKEV